MELKLCWTGMKVTGYYFVHPGEIVTQQYPESMEKKIFKQL